MAPVCSAVPKQRVAQCSSAQAAAPRLQQVLGAAALGLTLALAPMQPAHAAQARSLADVVRQDYSFVDVDSDGFITKCAVQPAQLCACHAKGGGGVQQQRWQQPAWASAAAALASLHCYGGSHCCFISLLQTSICQPIQRVSI